MDFAVGTRVRCDNHFRSTYMQTGVVTGGLVAPGMTEVEWDKNRGREERNPKFLALESSLEPFELGMVVRLNLNNHRWHPNHGKEGLISDKSGTYLYITFEGQHNYHESWVRFMKNRNTGGWLPRSVEYIRKERGMAFNVGDRVRFLSGPFKDTEATVNHTEQRGQLIWVTLPNGEKSGAWFPSRFVLVAKRDSPQEVEAVKGNKVQTYEVALLGLKRLVEAGVDGVSLRPRSWDKKGLYAAIVVQEQGGETKLYTPEAVDTFLSARSPIDVIGEKGLLGWRFRTPAPEGHTIYRVEGNSAYWTEPQILLNKGRVEYRGKWYRLCRNVPTPFVP